MQMRAKKTVTPVLKVKSLVTSLFDGKIDKRKKMMVLAIILYIISPIDIIPDVVPMAGYADDVLIPLLLLIAEKLISNEEDSERAK